MTSIGIGGEKDKRYELTHKNLLAGNFMTPGGENAKYLTICELGAKRSVIAANTANDKYGVPALYLAGGLSSLAAHKLIDNYDSLHAIQQAERNSILKLAVVLSTLECREYEALLAQLNFTWFESPLAFDYYELRVKSR